MVPASSLPMTVLTPKDKEGKEGGREKREKGEDGC